MGQGAYHVSITGLRLRAPWHIPRFWYHATRSMVQAKAAPGLVSADARTIKGVHHTRTVWDSRTSMITYLRSGAHREAMRVFPRMATGRVLGVELDHIPNWEETRRLWEEQAREVAAGR